jgi:hypothetical protein
VLPLSLGITCRRGDGGGDGSDGSGGWLVVAGLNALPLRRRGVVVRLGWSGASGAHGGGGRRYCG